VAVNRAAEVAVVNPAAAATEAADVAVAEAAARRASHPAAT
jgi:hypothetical protein